MTKADYEHYNKMSLKELLDASVEVYQAIQNEKIWMFGSRNDEDANMHAQNVDNLREELKYILTLVRMQEDEENV